MVYRASQRSNTVAASPTSEGDISGRVDAYSIAACRMPSRPFDAGGSISEVLTTGPSGTCGGTSAGGDCVEPDRSDDDDDVVTRIGQGDYPPEDGCWPR